MTSSTQREISQEMLGALHRSSGSYELVIGAVAAAAVGFGLDRWFGITPILTVLFASAGFIGASYSIWLQYSADMAAQSDVRSARRDARTGDLATEDVE